MKTRLIVAALAMAAAVASADDGKAKSTAAAKGKTKPAVVLKNDDQKIAYTAGFLTGVNNMRQMPDVDIDAFVAGIRDAYAKKEPLLNQDEMKAVLETYRGRLEQEAEAKFRVQAETNKAASEKFLAENKQKAGVTVTASGLQYEVLKAATGTTPKASDTVKVHYSGSLTNGEVFDSSRERGEPMSFVLDQVIPGWTEGLQLMPVGSTYRFVIPASLAYGEDAPPVIGPNQTLVFEVELLDIEKPAAAGPASEAATAAPAEQPAAEPAPAPEPKKKKGWWSK